MKITINTNNPIELDVGEYIKNKLYSKYPNCKVFINEFESTKGIINMTFKIQSFYKGEEFECGLTVCFAKDYYIPDLQYIDHLAERFCQVIKNEEKWIGR